MATVLSAVEVPAVHRGIAAYMRRRFGWFAPFKQRPKHRAIRSAGEDGSAAINMDILMNARRLISAGDQPVINIGAALSRILKHKTVHNIINDGSPVLHKQRHDSLVLNRRCGLQETLSSLAQIGQVHEATRGIATTDARLTLMSFVPTRSHVISVAPVFSTDRASGQSAEAWPSRQILSEHAGLSVGKTKEISRPGPPTKNDVAALVREFLDRQARLPPSGATMFDPRLSPAWPGLKMPL